MNQSSNLTRRVRTSGVWMAVGTLSGHVLRFGSSLVLTRLLMPEHFGVMALANVLMVAVSLLSDIGLQPALINSPRAHDAVFLSTLYTLQILRAAVIFLLCCLVALGIHGLASMGFFAAESVYAAASLPWLVVGMAFTVLISGWHSIKLLTATRDLQIGRVTVLELICQAAGLVCAAAVAYATRSIGALLVAPLVVSVLKLPLSRYWLAGPRDRLGWNLPVIWEVLRQARWIILSTLFTMGMMNADRLYLASVIDPATLGQYAIALALYGVFDAVVLQVVYKLVYPAFSEVQRNRPQDLPRVRRKTQLMLDLGLGGLAGGLSALAVTLVHLLYDSRYAAAGPMLSVIALGMVFARAGGAQAIFMAAGSFQKLTLTNAVSCLLLVVLLPLGYHAGGLAGAIAVVAFYRLPAQVLIWVLEARMGFAWTLRELVCLPAMAVGYGLGWGGDALLKMLLGA